MIIAILMLVGCAITLNFGDRSRIHLLQFTSKTRIHACMLCSGKHYQPETVSEKSSEVTDLLKAWMEESHMQEQDKMKNKDAMKKNDNAMKKREPKRTDVYERERDKEDNGIRN